MTKQTVIAWDRIRFVVFDFDGVFTDNTVIVSEDGSESVRCWRGDGIGLAMLKQVGIDTMVLSTEPNPVVGQRCAKLGIACEQGVDDKAARLADILTDRGLTPEVVAYVGNDRNDLGCLELVALPIVVADAHPSVRNAARIVTASAGGKGAVREVCERLVAAFGPIGNREG